MEVIFAIPVILVTLCWPVITGLAALSFGRRFWFWFFVGIPLPLIATIIVLCLPDKRQKINPIVSNEMKPVSNEEIFNYLIDDAVTNKTNKNEIYFSASA